MVQKMTLVSNRDESMFGVEDECLMLCRSIINILKILRILTLDSSRGAFRTHSKT